jgi:hypothetical protein
VRANDTGSKRGQAAVASEDELAAALPSNAQGSIPYEAKPLRTDAHGCKEKTTRISSPSARPSPHECSDYVRRVKAGQQRMGRYRRKR